MAHNKLTVACFDESGKFKDSEVVALAGCVAFPSTLDALANAWEKRIKRDGIPFTSMKEAVHFQGPYLKWKETPDKRDALIRDLGRMIVDAPMLRVATPIVTAEFKALPQAEREKLGSDPQYGAFEACILGTLYPRLDTDVHLVFDLSEQYSEKCVSLFHKLRRTNLGVKKRCVGLAFADDEVHAGLQVADMLAYCSRADAMRSIKTPDPIVEELISLFNSQDIEVGAVSYRLGGMGLGHGELEIDTGKTAFDER